MKKIFLLIALYSLQANAQWQPLFDGKSLNGWKKVAGTGEYEVRDGAIVGISVPNSPNTFLVSEKEYGDFILELEMKVEDTTSNTGVQFRSHFDPQANNGKGRVYGYQFEVDPSSRRWTGGIYDEARREWLYPLTLNPGVQDAFRLNEYNKIRIEAIGHTLRTFINGKEAAFLIDTVDATGFIALQVHGIGNPDHAGRKVYWKNIRIKTSKLKASPSNGIYIVNMIPNFLSPWEKKNGLTLLFDGKTSTGWTGAHKDHFPEKGWQIENGELRVLASNGGESTNGGDIVTNETFSAFDLSFDFKLTKGANSGVKYFVTLNEKSAGSAIGLEYQLLDDSLHPDAKMGREGNRTLASLYDLIKAQKTTRFIRQPGEWNRGRIVVYPDNRVEHYLNGIKVLEYQRGSQAYRDLVAISKYKVWENFGEAPAGRILLQDHGDAVSFRSVKLKML
ncbi:MAG: DUF1080 domain-containing protein [Chitinophagaceae bacterium]|nr:DUF1080 domain-containing protein [Chitinophagaceae bacterium]